MQQRILVATQNKHLNSRLDQRIIYPYLLRDDVFWPEEVYDRVVQNNYDVVMLDQATEQQETLAVLRYIQVESFGSRVVVFSDKLEDSKLDLLKAGADECLSTQAGDQEIKLRLQHLLRITKTAQHTGFFINGLHVIPEYNEVKDQRRKYPLKKKEFQLFLYLCRHKNRVVTRQQIGYHMWPEKEVHRNTIDSYIMRLRTKIVPLANQIDTIHGIGFILRDGQPDSYYSVNSVISQTSKQGA